jgi:hypothetical protein
VSQLQKDPPVSRPLTLSILFQGFALEHKHQIETMASGYLRGGAILSFSIQWYTFIHSTSLFALLPPLGG